MLALRAVSHLPLRATQGMAQSLFELTGLALTVPHDRTLPRRAAELKVGPARESHGPLPLALDGTGLKVYGEGQWKVRNHGASKRRSWRTLPPALDAETHEIQAVAVPESGADDAEEVGRLPEPIDREVARAAADGAYDQRQVYRAREPRAGTILIPPRRTARIREHGNAAGPPSARDEDLRHIRRAGRTAGEREAGYHVRSLAETGMLRMKPTFGGGSASRRLEYQVTAGTIRCRAWNLMTHLGMPDSSKVA